MTSDKVITEIKRVTFFSETQCTKYPAYQNLVPCFVCRNELERYSVRTAAYQYAVPFCYFCCFSCAMSTITLSHMPSFCLSNAIHGIGQIQSHLSVCLRVCLCLSNLSSTIATTIFVRKWYSWHCTSKTAKKSQKVQHIDIYAMWCWLLLHS